MIIYLTSSPTGSLDDSKIVEGLDPDNEFILNLERDIKDQARILLISASPDDAAGNSEMGEFFADAFFEAGFNLAEFTVMDRQNNLPSSEILSYDVIILGGGHIPTQMDFFYEIDLKETLSEYTGVLIGISAGSMALAKVIYALPEYEDEFFNLFYTRFIPGLALTDYQIIPHFNMNQDYIFEDVPLYDVVRADSCYWDFIILTDGSYLRIEGEKKEVYGESYLATNGEILPLAKNGECKLLL